MRNILLTLAFALILGAAAVLPGQTAEVGAIGAPTDNMTMPDNPATDETGAELAPPVNHALLGPSAQPEDTPPSFIPGFIGPSEKDNFKVTADENWYLDVDINMPGWLYIYEYFLVDEELQGRWIAYKWHLLESGIWRLGPFTAGRNESEGEHVYRIWFYGDNQWAAVDPDAPDNSLIYWTYSRGQPSEQPAAQIPPQPIPPTVEEAAPGEKANAFTIQPLVLALGSLLLVIIVAGGLYLYWRYAWRRRIQAAETVNEAETQEFSEALSPGAASARIALPNGLEIQLDGNSRAIGRGDLARALSLDELGLISRRHFEVKSEDDQFYIEDLDSANGTRLNGDDISGKGPVSLNDDDVIEPAGIIQLKFLLI